MKNQILIITAISMMQSIMPMEQPNDICTRFAEAMRAGTLVELLVKMSEADMLRSAHTLLLCMNRMKTRTTENCWEVVCCNPQSNEPITEPDLLLKQARKIIAAQLVCSLEEHTEQQMLRIKKLLEQESWERARQMIATRGLSVRRVYDNGGPLTKSLLDLDDPIVYHAVYKKVNVKLQLFGEPIQVLEF